MIAALNPHVRRFVVAQRTACVRGTAMGVYEGVQIKRRDAVLLHGQRCTAVEQGHSHRWRAAAELLPPRHRGPASRRTLLAGWRATAAVAVGLGLRDARVLRGVNLFRSGESVVRAVGAAELVLVRLKRRRQRVQDALGARAQQDPRNVLHLALVQIQQRRRGLGQVVKSKVEHDQVPGHCPVRALRGTQPVPRLQMAEAVVGVVRAAAPNPWSVQHLACRVEQCRHVRRVLVGHRVADDEAVRQRLGYRALRAHRALVRAGVLAAVALCEQADAASGVRWARGGSLVLRERVPSVGHVHLASGALVQQRGRAGGRRREEREESHWQGQQPAAELPQPAATPSPRQFIFSIGRVVNVYTAVFGVFEKRLF